MLARCWLLPRLPKSVLVRIARAWRVDVPRGSRKMEIASRLAAPTGRSMADVVRCLSHDELRAVVRRARLSGYAALSEDELRAAMSGNVASRGPGVRVGGAPLLERISRQAVEIDRAGWAMRLDLRPPAPHDAVSEMERRWRVRFPVGLRRLYTDVAEALTFSWFPPERERASPGADLEWRDGLDGHLSWDLRGLALFDQNRYSHRSFSVVPVFDDGSGNCIALESSRGRARRFVYWPVDGTRHLGREIGASIDVLLGDWSRVYWLAPSPTFAAHCVRRGRIRRECGPRPELARAETAIEATAGIGTGRTDADVRVERGRR